ncbi:hypothetical protein CTI12_AA073140 [Artemisia annua]|uniref:Uncharacterized protein n=1 Tax=Artemisia annua TaxID=35608 RepID=A0A2U1Q5D1_ARTAN|nr:hypothetical protein CTI12_AA073140 [Artemisia annua]
MRIFLNKQLIEMPRTRTRATGTGTSSGSEMENLNKYDDLLRCRTTTEEEEQPQEVHEEHKELVRCKEKQFVNEMNALGAERKKLLEDSPFYKLLEMSGKVQNNEKIKKLVSVFNTNDRSLLLPDGSRCVVTPQDFTSIMGVEDGDEEVDIHKNQVREPPSEQTRMFLSDNVKESLVSNIKVLKELKESKDKDTLNRAFALYALRFIICAPTKNSLPGSYLEYVENVSSIKKKKWATHAVECLVRGIDTYNKDKRQKTKTLSGCTVFLLLYVRKKISDTIPEELSEEARKKMIDEKLDELLGMRNKERADYSECVGVVKDIMRQRNANMISALEKVEKQCLLKVKNKKAKDFLKNDFEAMMFEIDRLLDARMTITDSILETWREEEFRRRTVISQKRKAENKLEKDATVGKGKKARRKVIEPKHTMQTRSQRILQPIGDRNFERDRNAEGVRNVRYVERDRNAERDINVEQDRNVKIQTVVIE